jgi:hypothetical protein
MGVVFEGSEAYGGRFLTSIGGELYGSVFGLVEWRFEPENHAFQGGYAPSMAQIRR